MSTYFISDIHLDVTTTANAQLLLDFLHNTGPQADAIYILGDLFALWFGDDLNPFYAQQIMQALKHLNENKIPVYFMRGNRDFLVGADFCAASGCTLLPDPCVIDLYGQKALLTHGDLLCTKDHSYQKFRSLVQNSIITKIFLSLPKWLRIKVGNWVKNAAKRKDRSKTQTNFNPEIYDAVPAIVEDWMHKFRTELLIHGHTHKPAIHQQNSGTRVVLGDWTAQAAKILVVTHDNSIKLHDLIT